MKRNPIDPQLLAVALDHATGEAFEDFVSEFNAALVGAEYVPMGGRADGGADGYVTDHLRYELKRPDHFLQTSIVEKVKSKIQHTVARLREVGRDPKLVTYFSNRAVSNSEQLEYELTTELGVLVRIRDRRYIAAQVNHNDHTRAAFDNHLRGFTNFLRKIGAASVIAKSEHVKHPDVFVFLRQEVDRRQGNAPLVDSVVDSLIVWALEGTDPDKGVYMTRAEIRARILGVFPSGKIYVESRLDDRLAVISRKTSPTGRLINWHKNEDLFVLPYETRERIASDNAEDEALKSGMLDQIRRRYAELLEDRLGEEGPAFAAKVTLRALQLAFESEGLEFARFITRADGGPHYHYLTDAVAVALKEFGAAQNVINDLGDAAMEVLRLVFYRSEEVERRYLERLSRTYSILFTLQSEPRLIEYFEDMSGTFHLYVGSDLIIRALSERYLAPGDQTTRNMLAMAATTGATLVLAEPVLDEVVFHIRASDYEFVNHVAPAEEYMTVDLARQASRILIRSYFYAKLGVSGGAGRVPKNWPAYVQQFCDYGLLHKDEAFAELRQYLQSQFSLKYESRADLEAVVKSDDVSSLAERLKDVKKNPKLAANDALMCHAVYGRRIALGESSVVSEFGFGTWWLTGGEMAILPYTEALQKAHHGARFMMRPDFLLNFISLSPNAAEARETFRNVFPTLLGIRIARRVDEHSFQKLMDLVEEAGELEEGRRVAKMSQLANTLKSDQRRQYHVDFEADRISPTGESIESSLVRP